MHTISGDMFESLRSSFGDKVHSLVLATSGGGRLSWPTTGAMMVVMVFVLAPLDLSQLIFAITGAAFYALIQSFQMSLQRRTDVLSKAAAVDRAAPGGGYGAAPGGRRGSHGAAGAPRAACGGAAAGTSAPAHRPPVPAAPSVTVPRVEDASATAPKKDVRKPSSMPISCHTFRGGSWDADVEELVEQIAPTPESDRAAGLLAAAVKQALRKMLPEAEVVGFASGGLACGKAFCVAVPDVDIVVSMPPDDLAERLHGRLATGRARAARLDFRKLQKSAIRVCTDRLVSSGGFKFRRSAFRCQEPKVTLLAPASLGIFPEAVPIDLSVNAVTPLYNAALLTECGQIDPRAKSLILVVRRWAKDRGICHAAKGHLSPYLWSLLSIYFLQDSAVLPPLEAFAASSGLMAPKAAGGHAAAPPKQRARPLGCNPDKTVGTLFKEFAHFFSVSFDWHREAVCVRLGVRGPPDLGLPLHIVLHDDGRTSEVGPSIDDPFSPGRNLGDCLTAESLKRLREELRRADELCVRNASLAELLEPWVPPEQESAELGKVEDE